MIAYNSQENGNFRLSDFQFDRYGRRLQYTYTLRGDMHASADCQSLWANPRFFCECAFVSISKSDQLETTVCIALRSRFAQQPVYQPIRRIFLEPSEQLWGNHWQHYSNLYIALAAG